MEKRKVRAVIATIIVIIVAVTAGGCGQQPAVEVEEPEEESLPAVEVEEPEEESLPAVEVEEPEEESLPAVEVEEPEEEKPPASWTIETVNSEGNVGIDISMTLDANNYPYIAYFNHTNDDLEWAIYDGSSWSIEVVDEEIYDTWKDIVEDRVGEESSIELDANGNPVIAYSYGEPTRGMVYASRADDGWDFEVIDTGSQVGVQLSMELDSQYNPHISYNKEYENRDPSVNLKHAFWNGSEWELETVLEGLLRDSADTAIAIDHNDDVHIAFSEETRGTMSYIRQVDGVWLDPVDVDPGTRTDQSVTLTLDSKGVPHMAYHDERNDTLKYATIVNGSWITQTIHDRGPISFDVAIAIDSEDRPHVIYNVMDSDGLRHALLNDDGSWQKEVIDPEGGGDAAVIIDSNGSIHVSYSSGEERDQDLKYARK